MKQKLVRSFLLFSVPPLMHREQLGVKICVVNWPEHCSRDVQKVNTVCVYEVGLSCVFIADSHWSKNTGMFTLYPHKSI